MSIRMIRGTALVLALLAGMLAFVVNPAAAQDSTPTADQPVTVGETELTWTGDWQYDPASSMDEQATLTQVDVTTGSLMLATYGEFADDTVDDPQGALDAFTGSFFDSAGAQSVVMVDSGELDNGGVWELHTFDLQGLQLTMLITVSQADGGEYVVSTLTANTETFSESLTTAQTEISLNGEPTYFEGVDAEQVGTSLNAAPSASPEATPAA